MKINFEKLKEHLLFELDEEETNEAIEQLKSWPFRIIRAMDDYIDGELLDGIDDLLGMDEEFLNLYYRELHPDFPEDEDISEADDYDDFLNNLTSEQRAECLWKSYSNARDNVSDDLRRNATLNTADFFGFPAFVVSSLCSNALPYFTPAWSGDDLDDKSTLEEIKAEFLNWIEWNPTGLRHIPDELKTEEFYFAAVQQNGKALKYVPDNLKAAVEAALKNASNG